MGQTKPKRHLIFRGLRWLALLGGLLLLFRLSWISVDYHRYRVRVDCSGEMKSYLLQIRDEPQALSDAGRIPVEADGFFVVGPYLPEAEQFALVGTKWYLSTSFTDHLFSGWLSERAYLDDGRQVLVFVMAGQPVCTAVLDRAEGDFLGSDPLFFSVTERLVSQQDPGSPTYWHVSRAQ